MKRQLKVKWSKREDDLEFHYPDHSANGQYLSYVLSHLKKDSNGNSILQELDQRGYDIKTLKISIDKKDTVHVQTSGERRLIRRDS